MTHPRIAEQRRKIAAAAAVAQNATEAFNTAVPEQGPPPPAKALPTDWCDDCGAIMARSAVMNVCGRCGLREKFIGTAVLIDGYPEARVYRRNRPFRYPKKTAGAL